MIKNTFVQQARIIDYMLHRKFPDAEFEVSVKKSFITNSRGFREINRRWIEVKCDFGEPEKYHVKDVIYWLTRFQDSEPDRRGDVYTRSFWVSKSGFASLGLVRRKRRDGTSSVEERYAPYNKNQTTLMRLPIQEYEVVNVLDLEKGRNTLKEEGWDEFTE